VLCTHDDAKVLTDLIGQRTEFTLAEKEKSELSVSNSPLITHHPQLNTTNLELLIYNNCELHIEVLGGIKITRLDRMKVTLKVVHKDKATLPIWHSLDLYNHAQREQAINNISEVFELGVQSTTNMLAQLTGALEDYRIKKIEALQPKQDKQPEMTPAQRQAAINELKKPNLLQRTSQLIAMSGIVGETTNSLIAYLVYCTRKQTVPLHVMFLGSSGSGKTYLQEKISELIPQEEKIEITQITENALYYFKQHELQNKLILIEDLDGALTTKEKIYEDNANRCLLLYTDQSKDQDKCINEYQTKLAAGEINRQREQQVKELFKNIQRVLQPIAVINPYAKHIQLPEQVFKPRRTMTLLLGFIEAVAFYHQYQREVKKNAAGELYIEATVQDIEAAFNLLKDVLFSRSDELTKAARNFLEQLKRYLQDGNLENFTPQQIRAAFRLQPRTLQRYIRELHQYGYIKLVSGYKHRKGYEYSITDAGEYSRLTSEIDNHLQAILAHLRQL